MSDDVKAANEALVESMLRQLRDCVSVGDEMTLDHACLIDDAADWIAGEPVRIAAKGEEVREACARHIWAMSRRPTAEELMEMVGFARSTPLTATPLADEIAAMRARVAELEAAANTAGADASAAALRAMARATKAEAERDEAQRGEQEAWRQTDQMRAERDALRARVFEVEQRQVGYVLVSFASHEQWKAELAELGALRARLDALYGVILFAHAFAEAEPLVSGYVRLHGHILHLREIHALARAATQAMDEAKP